MNPKEKLTETVIEKLSDVIDDLTNRGCMTTTDYIEICNRVMNHRVHRALHRDTYNFTMSMLYAMATMQTDARNEGTKTEASHAIDILSEEYATPYAITRKIEEERRAA